jgi:hypothetical protein
MKALQAFRRISGGASNDDPAPFERELAALRAKIGEHQAQAERLADEWRDADTSVSAELIDRQSREMLRLIERDSAEAARARGAASRRQSRRPGGRASPAPRDPGRNIPAAAQSAR